MVPMISLLGDLIGCPEVDKRTLGREKLECVASTCTSHPCPAGPSNRSIRLLRTFATEAPDVSEQKKEILTRIVSRLVLTHEQTYTQTSQ